MLEVQTVRFATRRPLTEPCLILMLPFFVARGLIYFVSLAGEMKVCQVEAKKVIHTISSGVARWTKEAS
jgi:hypothetical protein